MVDVAWVCGGTYVYVCRSGREVPDVGAQQERAGTPPPQPQEAENHLQLHYRSVSLYHSLTLISPSLLLFFVRVCLSPSLGLHLPLCVCLHLSPCLFIRTIDFPRSFSHTPNTLATVTRSSESERERL